MKLCPFCAEEVQDAAVVCKHCGRDLAQAAPKPEAQPQPQPVKVRARLGFATGPRLIAALVTVGSGFVLSFFARPIGTLGFFLMWGALAAILVNAGPALRFGLTWAGALLLCLPSSQMQQAREAALLAETAKKVEAARLLAADQAKAKAEEAAGSFKDRQASIVEELAALEGASKAKDWPNAQKRLQALQLEVTPLYSSSIAASPDVAAIKGRLDAQARLVAAAKAAEAARAAEAAEAARRAAWTPDPTMMSIRCARYAKEGILEGEATFPVGTLTKSGRTYIMRGQVIGHNAFNARIAKRATCRVYMDMKTGVETYTTSVD